MVLKLLFQQFLNLSNSQRDISGPILRYLSNNMWSGGTLGPLESIHFMEEPLKKRKLIFFFFFLRFWQYWSVICFTQDIKWCSIRKLSKNRMQGVPHLNAVGYQIDNPFVTAFRGMYIPINTVRKIGLCSPYGSCLSHNSLFFSLLDSRWG